MNNQLTLFTNKYLAEYSPSLTYNERRSIEQLIKGEGANINIAFTLMQNKGFSLKYCFIYAFELLGDWNWDSVWDGFENTGILTFFNEKMICGYKFEVWECEEEGRVVCNRKPFYDIFDKDRMYKNPDISKIKAAFYEWFIDNFAAIKTQLNYA